MTRAVLFLVAFVPACMVGEDTPYRAPVAGTPVDSIVAGAFAPLPGYGQLAATGGVLVIRSHEATTIQVHLDRLTPQLDYPAHVHSLPCSAAGGGHYAIDPSLAAGASNEIALHIDADDKGSGDVSIDVPSKLRGDALSLVVHNPTDGTKMLCADLVNTNAMPVDARGAIAPFADAAPQDQSLTGTAQLTRAPGSTTVTLSLSGLAAGATYKAHVHTLPCGVALAGGHYMKDPLLTPSTEENELWPAIMPTASGTSTSVLAVAQHVARADAQSVVVHRMDTALIKVACADLTVERQVDLIARGTGTALQVAADRGLHDLFVTVALVRQLDGTTKLVLTATGLGTEQTYMAHVHNRPCTVESGGGHYRIDPAAADQADNVISLELTSSASGTAAAMRQISGLARPDAQSIVIHDPQDNARLACVDVAPL